MSQPKTTQQNKIIFALAAARDLSHDDVRELAGEISGKKSVSALSKNHAEMLINRLRTGTTLAQPQTIVSRRTINYRRQKAGIKQTASPTQIELMNTLATKRGITEDGLKSLCNRIIKRDFPTTTEQTSKIIEALKSMISRDKANKTQEVAR